MPKQCEFSTLQGMSTQITPQKYTNTSDIHKHHSYTPSQPPRHHQDICRQQKTPTHVNRHQQTSANTFSHPQTTPGSVWGCLGVSVGFCWCLLMSVCFCWCLEISEWCLEGVLGVFGWCLWMSVVLRCVWGVTWLIIPCKVENSYCFGIAPKGKVFFTWPYWDIKISKCLYASSTKMVGFSHLFVFECLSEINHKIQLLLITL